MTEAERERIQRGMKVLGNYREFALSLKYLRDIMALMLVVPDKFAPWADQLLRASTSIACNVAEGQGRGTEKQIVQYYRIARGSCWECLSLVYAAPQGVNILGLAEQLAEISRAIDQTMLDTASGMF